MSINTIHPPDTKQLETVLPRLGLLERLALRIALRGILRLEAIDREAAVRRHELVLDNERRREAADRRDLLLRPMR